jgi:hypothetical protein
MDDISRLLELFARAQSELGPTSMQRKESSDCENFGTVFGSKVRPKRQGETPVVTPMDVNVLATMGMFALALVAVQPAC